MTDAIAKPSKRRGPDPREDAFLRFINRLVDWTRQNVRAVIAASAGLVLLAVAGLWYLNYSQNLEAEAASRLQSIRAAVATGADTVGTERLASFLDRFAGTESAGEARVLLARLQLRRGRPAEAVEVIRPAVDQPADTPSGYASRMLLAKAQEAAGRREAALRTLEELARNARFGFQRREAAAQRASILVEMDRLAEAEAVYRRLVEESGDPAARQMYAVRLGEVQAMRTAEAAASAAEGSGEEEPATSS